MTGERPSAAELLEEVVAGRRLSPEESRRLMDEADLLTLGRAAGRIRSRLHPEGLATFVGDRNINYTNVCVTACRFCAFFRAPGHPDGYVLDRETIYRKLAETVAAGGTQILMQGGIHPDLDLAWFCDLLRDIKSRFAIHIHSFSPPEIQHLARTEGLSVKQVLEILRSAGLDSMPGGGAEILADRVRAEISPRKIGWREWCEVMETAHRLGMKTTATMMFGSVETGEERILHLIRVRDLQERSLAYWRDLGVEPFGPDGQLRPEAGAFTAFIPWSFQPANTALEPLFSGSKGRRPASAWEYLTMVALARLILDNVPNIQASWVTQGAKMAQVALAFGCNDFGGTMLEENVVRAAGVSYRVAVEEIIAAIRGAGLRPAQRDTYYRILKQF